MRSAAASDEPSRRLSALEARRQRAAGQRDARFCRQIDHVVGERQRVDVELDRRLASLGERHRGTTEREVRAVDLAPEPRSDRDVGLVRQR